MYNLPKLLIGILILGLIFMMFSRVTANFILKNADVIPVHYIKAVASEEKGDYKKAVEHYKKALERILQSPKDELKVAPFDFAVYHNLGASLQRCGNYDEAFEAYSNALEVTRRESALAHYGRGYIYMNQKQFDKAMQEYDRAIALNPNMYDAHQNRAVMFRLMERYQDSVDACKKVIDKFPDSAKTYSSLGWAFEKMGRFEEAIEAYMEAIRLSPKWRFPKEKISYCFSQLKNQESVARLLDKLKKEDFALAEEISQILK